MTRLVQQDVREDLPQPRSQLGLGAAAELGEITHGFEQGLLDDVGGIELRAKSRVDLQAGKKAEPGAVTLEGSYGDRIEAGALIWIAHGHLAGRERSIREERRAMAFEPPYEILASATARRRSLLATWIALMIGQAKSARHATATAPGSAISYHPHHE